MLELTFKAGETPARLAQALLSQHSLDIISIKGDSILKRFFEPTEIREDVKNYEIINRLCCHLISEPLIDDTACYLAVSVLLDAERTAVRIASGGSKDLVYSINSKRYPNLISLSREENRNLVANKLATYSRERVAANIGGAPIAAPIAAPIGRVKLKVTPLTRQQKERQKGDREAAKGSSPMESFLNKIEAAIVQPAPIAAPLAALVDAPEQAASALSLNGDVSHKANVREKKRGGSPCLSSGSVEASSPHRPGKKSRRVVTAEEAQDGSDRDLSTLSLVTSRSEKLSSLNLSNSLTASLSRKSGSDEDSGMWRNKAQGLAGIHGASSSSFVAKEHAKRSNAASAAPHISAA